MDTIKTRADLDDQTRELLDILRDRPDLFPIMLKVVTGATRFGTAFLEETTAATQAGNLADSTAAIDRIFEKWEARSAAATVSN